MTHIRTIYILSLIFLMASACLNIEDDDAPETAGRLEFTENNFFRKPVGNNPSLAGDIAAEAAGLTAPSGGGGEDNGGTIIGNRFYCADGEEDIPAAWVCDGDPDCDDGSDEWNCGGNGGDLTGACAELADCVCPMFTGTERTECYADVTTMSAAECTMALDMSGDFCL